MKTAAATASKRRQHIPLPRGAKPPNQTPLRVNHRESLKSVASELAVAKQI